MTKHAWFGLAVCLVFGTASAAHAQRTDDERARAHFLAGNSYFEQARYQDAHDQFLEAYELSHRVELLLNASKAAERYLDFEEAIRLVDLFFQNAPPDHAMRSVETTRREQLVILRDRQAATQAQNPPPSTTQSASTSQTPAEQERGGLGTLGWVGVGVAGGGVALGVVSLATGLVANGKYGDLEDDCPGGVCPPGSQGRIDAGRRMARLSTATTIIGAAGVIGGVILIIVDDGPEQSGTASARPTVTGGPGEAGLGLRWSF